jgi:Tol biopolymer transport system component
VSPDGRRAAVVVGDGANNDVWIRDFARQVFTRFSFGGNNTTPVWTADGRTLYYAALESTGRKTTIFRKPLDGSRDAERVGTLDARVYLKHVDETRGELLVDAQRMLQQGDIERVLFGGGKQPRSQPLVATTFDETGGSQSPDGRWLSYSSDETSRYEIYVRDARTDGGGRWQVSTVGGEEPRWSRDGRRLYFRSGSRFMAADVTLHPSFESSTPAVLFDGVYEYRTDTAVTYSVDATDTKFLMIRPLEAATGADAVRVLLHWSPGQVR